MEHSETERGRLMSTREAAHYLGYSSPGSLRWHVYVSRQIVPDGIIGRSLYFYEATLDEFYDRRRTPGRPRRPEV